MANYINTLAIFRTMYDIVIGRKKVDLEKYGTKGTILLGKHYVKMGQVTSMSNNILLDVTRSHVVFVCGKRGGGKCLHGDTLITLSDGSQIPVKELDDTDKDILSLNQDLKICSTQKDEFFKRIVKKLFVLKLRSGKEIKITEEHPLLTIKGWIPVKDLGIGSRIATPREIGFFGEKDVSEEKIKILAYLIAEGHISNNFILFTNKDNKILNDYKKSIKEFDSALKLNHHSSKYTLRVVQNRKRKVNAIRDEKGRFLLGSKFDSKSSLRKWLNEINLYGKLSGDKFVPELIFNLPKNKVSLFLNRLFSCDGTIWSEKNVWKVSYSSKSKKLIRQVHHLLLKFGILSKIRTKKTSFELEIKGMNVTKFIQEIGFYGYKETKQRIALVESEKIKRNPNLDTIPKEIWNNYRPENWASIGREMDYKHPKALRESIRYSPSRQKLAQIAVYDQRQDILKIAESDIYWDEIVGIKELNGDFEVYDITVPEHHNFIVNDIIVHNSYTMGVIAEGVSDLEPQIRDNISVVILDTMGIYWTMKYPNQKERDLLDKWGIKPKALDVSIFTPTGYYKSFKEKGIPTDYPFSIKPSELDFDDWVLSLGVDKNSEEGVLIERVITDLKESGKNFSLKDIRDLIEKDQKVSQKAKDKSLNLFSNAETWGLFDENGTPINDLVKGGQVTVLDVSIYATMPGGWDIKALVIGLISKKLFIQRMVARKDEEFQAVHETVHYFAEEKQKKMDHPLVWLVIDECHEFLPKEGKTAASDALITILREGRQPGISLVAATQQPGKIHTDVMTQSDIILSHRITAKLDTDALGMLMQSYMRKGLDNYLDDLPREDGAAIILDDNNERMYPMRVRPRFTWHGGEAPVAIPGEKKIFNF